MTVPAGPAPGTADLPSHLPAAPPPPRLADGLVLLGLLHGSGHVQAPGLVRRADGQTVQVTGLLHELLQCVDGKAGPEVLAQRLSARVDLDVTEEDVAWLLEHRLRPAGLLQDDDGAAPERPRATPLLALRLKYVVTDPAVTSRLTAPFAALFTPWLVWPVLAAFVATCWFVLVEKGLGSAARSAIYEPGLLLAVVALTVLSAGFHELGHAAACRYGGARPGAMGVGVYLVWPAFYTDVDDSYRLSRWGRLRVDLGGLYFNCLVAVLVMGAWLLWREDALLLGVATQLLQMVRQLAPFVRADGYHILADLTGVPDLFAHIRPTLLALVPGRRAARPVVPLKTWARVVVTGWVLVVVPVLLGLLVLAVVLLPRLAATAWDSAGLHAGLLAEAVRALDPVAASARLLTLVALALPVAGTTYLLVRVVRSTWRAGWRASHGDRRLQAGLVLLAVAAAALTAWSWVPEQQRTPLQAGEQGRLPSLLAAPAPAPRVVPVAQPAPVAVGPPSGLGPPRVVLVRRAAPRPVAGPVVRLVAAGPRPALPVLAAPAPAPAVLRAEPGRQFRFALPAPPDAQGNQALALGRRDGGRSTEVAYGLVQLVDPSRVTARNEAYALATCARCTTVAVAFQVVLVVGDAPVVVPVNAAVAVNDDCLECVTRAVAVQLVATLNGLPTAQVEAELRRVLAGLAPLRGRAGAQLGTAGLYAAVKAVEAEVVDVLLRNGLVRPEDVRSSTTRSGTTKAAAGPSTLPAASPTPAAAAQRPTSPSPTAPAPVGALGEAPPLPSATPSPSSGPTASPGSTPAASPGPTASPGSTSVGSPGPMSTPGSGPVVSPGPTTSPGTTPAPPSPSPGPLAGPTAAPTAPASATPVAQPATVGGTSDPTPSPTPSPVPSEQTTPSPAATP